MNYTNIKELFEKGYAVVLILFAGVLYRVIGYPASAIWYDEAISLYRARLPLNVLATDHLKYGSHLVWELLLRPFAAISQSLWVIRLPALLFGCSSLIIVWLLMKRMEFSILGQILSGILVAFLPGLIWTTQDARPYAMISFLLILSAYYAIQRRWLGLLAASGLLAISHQIGPLYVTGPLVMALYLWPRELKHIVLVGFGAFLSWLPWLFYIFFRTNNLTTFQFWLHENLLTYFPNAWHQALWVGTLNSGYKLLLPFLLSIISILLVITTHGRQQIAMFLLFISPLFAMISVSLALQNVTFYRTLEPILIPFCLLVGCNLNYLLKSPAKRAVGAIITLVWIALLIISASNWNPANRGGNLDQAAAYIRENWQSGDILYYATGTVALPFDYYLNDKQNYLMDGISNPNLTPPTLHGYQFAALDEIPYRHAWVIYPQEPLLTAEQIERLDQNVQGSNPVYRITAFQFSPILVYRVP